MLAWENGSRRLFLSICDPPAVSSGLVYSTGCELLPFGQDIIPVLKWDIFLDRDFSKEEINGLETTFKVLKTLGK